MLQRSRSHLTILLSSLGLLVCISGAEILAAHPATSRQRQPRQSRLGSPRPVEHHLDGETHPESALHNRRGLLSESNARLTSGGKANRRGVDETPVSACIPLQSHHFVVTTLLFPAALPCSKSLEQCPSPGRSPPSA